MLYANNLHVSYNVRILMTLMMVFFLSYHNFMSQGVSLIILMISKTYKWFAEQIDSLITRKRHVNDISAVFFVLFYLFFFIYEAS